jgi:colanic acid/amylovoran biosynthesis glycosyltransferase
VRVAVLTDLFPELSETFVVSELRALERLGHEVRVEAGRRAERPNPDAEGARAAYLEDDGALVRLVDLAWLLARHPGRCVADLRSRRGWAREEKVRPLRGLAPAARRVTRYGDEHLHAHFASGAALDALRLGRLLDLPYSVTAHAFDIYAEPRNLREKLESAAFATSGCDYTVRDLRAIAPAARVEKVVMGVDGERFRRSAPPPGDRTVAAVGRLVEKKGFEQLVEAAAQLRQRAPLVRVVITGEGPLRGPLEDLVRVRGLEGVVELPGALEPDGVHRLLEGADLLVMPSVIAPDGDRDSMPVAVKEALAMEVPVVASDEVGLPELVRPEWGRLVPPGDPDALAAAIGELLALTTEERAAMGRAGRAFVLEHCDVDREAAKLAALIEASGADCAARGGRPDVPGMRTREVP